MITYACPGYIISLSSLQNKCWTLTGKTGVGPASFPSLSYINFGKIVLRLGKLLILFWRLIEPQMACIREFIMANILHIQMYFIEKNSFHFNLKFLWNFNVKYFYSKLNLIVFALKDPVNDRSSLFQVIAWCQRGTKRLPEPMMTHFADSYMCHQQGYI